MPAGRPAKIEQEDWAYEYVWLRAGRARAICRDLGAGACVSRPCQAGAEMIPRRVESVAETRLLILAGRPEDAELVKGALRKTGLSFRSRQVDSKSALMAIAPTVGVADSKVPGCSARTALDHVQQRVEARADSLEVRGISLRRRSSSSLSENITQPNGTLLGCLRWP